MIGCHDGVCVGLICRSSVCLRTHPPTPHVHKLQPKLKSEEPAAEDMAKPVKVIKGKSFKKEVVDAKKDVLLEFYAPWWCVPLSLNVRAVHSWID